MTYRLVILRRAQKQLAALPHDSYERCKQAISALSNEPRPPNSLKLRGRDGWRLRVGTYRIVYEIDDASKQVEIIDVDHRKDIYR